jgi:hypothetical protein
MKATTGYLFFLLNVFVAPSLVGLAAAYQNVWILVSAALVFVLGTVFGMLWATQEGGLD